MILPKSLLEQVEYYEVKEERTQSGFRTKIILHFKQWWKPRKVFKFNWAFVEKKSDSISVHKPLNEDLELRVQLANYFKEM